MTSADRAILPIVGYPVVQHEIPELRMNSAGNESADPDTRDPVLVFYETEHARAWEHFANDRDEACFEICRDLLMYPDLGDVFVAGCHVMLAYSEMSQIEHAEIALQLLHEMYNKRHDTKRHEVLGPMIKAAEDALEHAKEVDVFAKKSDKSMEDAERGEESITTTSTPLKHSPKATQTPGFESTSEVFGQDICGPGEPRLPSRAHRVSASGFSPAALSVSQGARGDIPGGQGSSRKAPET